MKWIYIAFIALFFSTASLASYATVLDDVKARISIQGQQRGNFSQEKAIAKLSKPLVATGHFIYLPERGLLWSIETPYASNTLITQSLMVQSVKGKVILRTDATSQPGYLAVSRIFMALISTDIKALEKDFRIAGKIDGSSWQLILTPKSGLFANFAKTITIRGEKYLQQISIAEKNGDSTNYRFSDIQLIGRLSADENAQFNLH